jgi:hypothetical protein
MQAKAQISPADSTKWNLEPSFKYDALCYLNILTGDTFYLKYYNDEFNKLSSKLTPEASAALSHIKTVLKQQNGIIISAHLCLYFSAVEDTSLEQMIKTCGDMSVLKSNFQKTPYYDEGAWNLFESLKDDLKEVFKFLISVDFYSYWRSNILPKVNDKINQTYPGLNKYNVIAEDENMLGFKLPSNQIIVYMLYYVKPHGIKITGTRFLTAIDWPFEIVIRNAVHEMMHPPYDYKNDDELRGVIDSLKSDEFLMDKVLDHNPSFGYNSLDGLIEEDCVQALEQLINEKLGIAVDARKRWKSQDDGIHVFAIALYQIMKDEKYNYKNEIFRDFLVRMIGSGKLAAGKIKLYNEDFFSN